MADGRCHSAAWSIVYCSSPPDLRSCHGPADSRNSRTLPLNTRSACRDGDPGPGAGTRTEHTLTADGAEQPAATLTDVAWLQGQWRGEGLGAVVEETWLPAAGGAMAGVFRLVDEGTVRFYELVTVTEEAGSLVLRLKHFNADLTGWEAAEETVDFPLLRLSPDTLWFDGLTMAREGEGGMRIWVALEQSSGDVSEGVFVYRRVEPRP